MPTAPASCPVDLALTVFSGVWRLLTVHHLSQGSRRYTELERLLPAISPRMLVKVLRELEGYGLVHRHMQAVVPPHVEYSLTLLGRSVSPLLVALRAWGTQYQAAQATGECPWPELSRDYFLR